MVGRAICHARRLDDPLDALVVVVLRREQQRRVAVGRREVGVGARVEERLEAVGVVGGRAQHARRVAILVLLVGRGAKIEQQLEALGLARFGRHVHRRGALVVGGAVDVGARLEHARAIRMPYTSCHAHEREDAHAWGDHVRAPAWRFHLEQRIEHVDRAVLRGHQRRRRPRGHERRVGARLEAEAHGGRTPAIGRTIRCNQMPSA